MLTTAEVKSLNRRFAGADTPEILRWAWEWFGYQASIGTSFQGSGLVMIDLCRKAGLPFPVFTIDTGLLFPDTVALKSRLESFFDITIETLRPDLTVDEQADVHGPELWKREPDLCCTVRKVLPLRDKLSGIDCWITGLRRQQSTARTNTDLIELYVFDESTGKNIVKLNPMADWTRDAIWRYIRDRKIPYNPLQDQGYRSIGCEPCTRRTSNGEPERAGRWTGFDKVECGIHTFLPKKVDFQI